MENSSKIPTERIDVLDAKLTTIDNSILSIQQSILDLNTRLEEVNTNLTTLVNNNYTDLNTKITALQTRATNLEARRYVTTYWKSGTSWYRIWSDGFIEQGAYSTNKTNSQTVTYFKPFTQMPSLQTTIVTTRGAASYDGEIFPRSVTKTNFVFGSRLSDCSAWHWMAYGY